MGVNTADDQEGWLPLPEAFERWSDPRLWHAYQSAPVPEARRPAGTGGWFGRRGPDRFQFDDRPRPAPRPDHRAIAWTALIHDFKRRLRAGELLATGLDAQLRLESRRQPIRAELWEVLALDVSRGQARSGGLRILRIHVRRATTASAVQVPEADTLEISQPRRPGPKSLMPRIEAEMRARAARGELKDGVGHECRALERWAKANNPKHPRVPKAKSIQNALGKIYYELKLLAGARI